MLVRLTHFGGKRQAASAATADCVTRYISTYKRQQTELWNWAVIGPSQASAFQVLLAFLEVLVL